MGTQSSGGGDTELAESDELENALYQPYRSVDGMDKASAVVSMLSLRWHPGSCVCVCVFLCVLCSVPYLRALSMLAVPSSMTIVCTTASKIFLFDLDASYGDKRC